MYVAELDLVSADGGDCYAVLFDLFFETALLVLKSTVVLPAVVCFFEPVRSYLYAVFLVVVVAAGAAAVATAVPMPLLLPLRMPAQYIRAAVLLV